MTQPDLFGLETIPGELDRFEEFWQVYPRHVSKSNARKAWVKIISKRWVYDVQDYIIAAVKNQKESNLHLKREEQFIPHAATWLNGERWLDEVQTSFEDMYVR